MVQVRAPQPVLVTVPVRAEFRPQQFPGQLVPVLKESRRPGLHYRMRAEAWPRYRGRKVGSAAKDGCPRRPAVGHLGWANLRGAFSVLARHPFPQVVGFSPMPPALIRLVHGKLSFSHFQLLSPLPASGHDGRAGSLRGGSGTRATPLSIWGGRLRCDARAHSSSRRRTGGRNRRRGQ